MVSDFVLSLWIAISEKVRYQLHLNAQFFQLRAIAECIQE